MKQFFILICFALCASSTLFGQTPELKLNLSNNGYYYLKGNLLNQVWVRYNESNPGTMVNGQAQSNTFDIGLRRTRFQLYGKVLPHTFVYFQYGQNNFNSILTTSTTNRKLQAFFHDAVCEFSPNDSSDKLKIGGGLTILNGLSRFSQPSISSIVTLDVPVFAQATVDQTDQFSRKLSIYARGQLGRFDYRVALSDPFTINTNGAPIGAVSPNSTFAYKGHSLQQQGYFMWQFFDKESHITPYMAGTYLGKKKILNLGGGVIYQPKATWTRASVGADTSYHNMLLWSTEALMELPLNKEKQNMIHAYAGYYNFNYGPGYLRYNGAMNPANGGGASFASNTFGNAIPMFGTGNVIHAQVAYKMKNGLLGKTMGTFMPYLSATRYDYTRLNQAAMDYHAGLNWLVSGHNSKITVDYGLRSYYATSSSDATKGDFKGYKSCVMLQYQIFL